jgi:hypothetical protein
VRVNTPDRSSLLIKSRPPRLVCSECEDFDVRPAVAIDLLDEVLLDMRSSLVVRASDCQCRSRNSPGCDHSIPRHSGI